MWSAYKKYYARVFMTALTLYLVFVVDLGTGSLAQHLYRIGTTPEGRQLGSELGDTLVAISHMLIDRLSALFSSSE
jgi:hypothetical protein